MAVSHPDPAEMERCLSEALIHALRTCHALQHDWFESSSQGTSDKARDVARELQDIIRQLRERSGDAGGGTHGASVGLPVVDGVGRIMGTFTPAVQWTTVEEARRAANSPYVLAALHDTAGVMQLLHDARKEDAAKGHQQTHFRIPQGQNGKNIPLVDYVVSEVRGMGYIVKKRTVGYMKDREMACLDIWREAPSGATPALLADHVVGALDTLGYVRDTWPSPEGSPVAFVIGGCSAEVRWSEGVGAFIAPRTRLQSEHVIKHAREVVERLLALPYLKNYQVRYSEQQKGAWCVVVRPLDAHGDAMQ